MNKLRNYILLFLSTAIILFSAELNHYSSSTPQEAVSNQISSTAKAKSTTRLNWFKDAKYGLNVAFFPESYPQFKGKDLSDGTWNRMVEDFDVKGFVSDVLKTGSKYVIFSVGQTSGYYTSPSSVFTTATKTKVGEFVPRRDLVKDIAVALKKYNIPLIAYAGVQGPSTAPPKITNTFPARNDQADDENRKTFNAMIREWSGRWGTNVAGWWLDGCYPWVAGFGNTPAGEANIDALITATKWGNKQAISTCNPSIEIFKPLSVNQDFMAGEEAYFHRYPRNRFIKYKGQQLQWHVMSFLGKNWSEASSNRYTKRQLVEYVKSVSQLGGVVTIDASVTTKGRIVKNQLQQMAEVKRVIRTKGKLTDISNLALFKPVYMISNNLGGYELPVNENIYAHYGYYAVDGQNSRTAHAANEYAWSLLLDLRELSSIKRSTVTFPHNTFPTHYLISASSDGLKWKILVDRKISVGATYNDSFETISARYVKVTAVKPDGANQIGSQMAISEFELYRK
jgi:F5/8 type C domain/Alpha-L-fucosidase